MMIRSIDNCIIDRQRFNKCTKCDSCTCYNEDIKKLSNILNELKVSPKDRCFNYYLLGSYELLPFYKYGELMLTDYYKKTNKEFINHTKLMILINMDSMKFPIDIETDYCKSDKEYANELSRELIFTLNELQYFPGKHYEIVNGEIELYDEIYDIVFDVQTSETDGDVEYIPNEKYKIMNTLLENYNYYMYRYLFLSKFNPELLYHFIK